MEGKIVWLWKLSPTHCVGQISVASVGLEKARLSGREALAGASPMLAVSDR